MNDILKLSGSEFIGTVNRFDESIRYDQTKNGVEQIIKKVRAEDNTKKGYLESCGISAACCCWEAIGEITKKDYLYFPSGVLASFDDAVMCHVNSYHLYEQDPDRFDNRYARTYPKLAQTILKNVESFYVKYTTFTDVVAALAQEKAVQICLEDPGHWIAVIGYIVKTKELVFMDSWGSRNKGLPKIKNNGIFERMTRQEFDGNVMDFMITYEKVG